MRFRLTDVPFWSLLSLPLFVAFTGYGFFSTLALVILWAVARQAVIINNLRRLIRSPLFILALVEPALSQLRTFLSPIFFAAGPRTNA